MGRRARAAGRAVGRRLAPRPDTPRDRQLQRALDYIRDHHGEQIREERVRRERVRRRRSLTPAEAAREAREEGPGGDVVAGDVLAGGDLVQWLVVEARPAGRGRYVLVVER